MNTLVHRFVQFIKDNNDINTKAEIIDEKGIVNVILCSVFHDKLLKSTVLQEHWAGRALRGTAQFCDKSVNEMLCEPDFKNNINCEAARAFLHTLINR